MAESSNIVAITAAAAALVDAVAGTANVYVGARLTHDWGKFIAQFQEVYDDDGTPKARVNGWTVSWVGHKETRKTSMENDVEHAFKVRGYYTVREFVDGDANTSEGEFDLLIAAILDQIRTTHDLSGTANLGGPGNMTLKNESIFGDVLCHYTEITFTATETLLGD